MTVNKVNSILKSLNDNKFNDLINRIVTFRKSSGLTQKELAAAIGVTQACLSGIESGKLHSFGKTLISYCNYYGLDIQKFITGEIVTNTSSDDTYFNEIAATYDLTTEESNFIKAFLKMTSDKRSSIITALKVLGVHQ